MNLEWAVDRRDVHVHVGALDGRRRRDRAPFSCPECGEPLVARLGAIRARHFAHRPGSVCPLTSPETALHRNAKEHLLWLCGEAFAGRRRVLLATRCPGCRRPAPVEIAAVGDAAALEGAVGALRADVLVTRGGSPVLALEVRVAHAVEAEKEDALADLGVPVAEVDANAPWERSEGPATVVECCRTAGFPPCPSCATRARSEAGASGGGDEADRAALEAYRARGLLGPPPGPPISGDPTLTVEDHGRLRARFRCPECGSGSLLLGERVVRHACPGADPRAVAWRGYDGAVVAMRWWQES